MVFYFTATGNSLYAARQLDANIMSIPQAMRCSCLRRFSDETIGVVYPIFGHRPPELVQRFLREVELDTPYLYIIPTYGARHANAVDIVLDICRASGKTPAYVHTLLMVDNYLPAFDMDEQRKMDKNVQGQLDAILSDLKERREMISPVTDTDRAAHRQFLDRMSQMPPDAWQHLLRVTDSCIGCGICEQVCPSGSIHLEQGKAVHVPGNCQTCLACAHACPQKAIALTVPEKNPNARYRNEHISLQEIIRANHQLSNL